MNIHMGYPSNDFVYYVGTINTSDATVTHDIRQAWSPDSNLVNYGGGMTFSYVIEQDDYSGKKPYIILNESTWDTAYNVGELILYIFNNSTGNSADSLEEQISVMKTAIIESFKANYNIDLDTSIADNIIKMCIGFVEYLKSDNYDLCVHRVSSIDGPMELDDLIVNAKLNSKTSFVDPSKNKTLYMEKPDSQLFIKIPRIEDIKNNYFNGLKMIPKRQDIMPEPLDPLFLTPQYVQVTRNSTRYLVEGDSRNNKLPIQANEKLYYDAICKMLTLAREDMETTYKTPEGEEVEAGEHSITYQAIRFYLIYLIEAAARFNWAHNARIVLSREDEIYDSDDDDNSSSTSDDVYGSNAYRYTTDIDILGNMSAATIRNLRKSDNISEEQKRRIDAMLRRPSDDIIGEVYDMLFEIDRNCIAEFLIKMLRWGNRKPTAITFSCFESGSSVNSDVNPFEFDLAGFRPTTPSSSFVNSELKIVDGHEFMFDSLIVSGTVVKDTEFCYQEIGTSMSIPSSVVGMKTYREYIGDQDISYKQYVYLSLFDILEIVAADPERIEGITLARDGTIKFEVPERVGNPRAIRLGGVLTDVSRSKGEHLLYVSDTVTKNSVNLNASGDFGAYLRIINEIFTNSDLSNMVGLGSFDTLQQASEIITERNCTNDELLIAKMVADSSAPLLNTLRKAAETDSVSDISYLLNTLHDFMRGGSNMSGAQSNVNITNAAAVEKLNVFGGSGGTSNPNPGNTVPDMIVQEIGEANLCAYLATKDPYKEYFGLLRDTKGVSKIYKLDNPEFVNYVKEHPNTVKRYFVSNVAEKVIYNVFSDLLSGPNPKLSYVFDSVETCKGLLEIYADGKKVK